MHITRLTENEGARLRQIRLRALREAPDAFGQPYAHAEALPDDSWRAQLRKMATYVAVVDGIDVGMVRGGLDDDDQTTAWLFSMWVDPTTRGQGVGVALIKAVIDWGRSVHARRILLDVGDKNAPAIALYARMGFQPKGHVMSFAPPREHIHEHQRELIL